MKLQEEINHWSLGLDDGHVQMIRIDFQLGLLLVDGANHAWLRVATACKLQNAGHETLLIPEQASSLSPILPIFNAAVTGVTVAKDGRLVANFGNGAILEILPDDAYEAWELACSIGETRYLLVCSPGGKVAFFRDSGGRPLSEHSDRDLRE